MVGGSHAPLGQITEQIDQQFSTNVKGVVLTVQGALGMKDSGVSIVIVGSTVSIDPEPAMTIYGGSLRATPQRH